MTFELASGDEHWTFSYDPTEASRPLLEEGVTRGWVVVHNGIGPARCMEVVSLVDQEGGVIVSTGEWQDVTVVDITSE